MGTESEFQERARDLAERIYDAYVQQATMPAHPLGEQTVVTRLVEAIEPCAEEDAAALAEAANRVLDAWEAREPAIRGPRVASASLITGAVTLRPH